MNDLASDITKWLMQRPAWQQEAVERQLKKGDLSDSDIDEIASMLKSSTGPIPSTTPTFSGLQGVGQNSEALRLVSIGDIQGIESLKPFRPLDFGEGNLSVIYGHNGSGKSGYTRILKRICGHPRANQLRHNIFEAPPEKKQCTVIYQVDSDIHEEVWHADSDPIDRLRVVDIFDSEAATFYLSSETDVTYTPPQIALFEQLSDTCNRVKALLKREQGELVVALPRIPAEYVSTPTAISYQSQSLHKLPAAVINDLKSWTQSEQKNLDDLLYRLKTADPAAVARQKRQIKVHVDQLVSRIMASSEALGAEQIQGIQNKQQDALTKRRIATEAVKVQSAQLNGVGTETWRALWEAARKYSIGEAYPGREFPATNEGDRCVLCHQDLGPDARKRLQEFDASIRGTLESAASNAEETYTKALERLPTWMTSVEITAVCTAALDDSWAPVLTEFWAQVQLSCKRLGDPQEQTMPIATPAENIERLQSYSDTLEAVALQFDQDASQFDREKAADIKLNLEAKRWTAQQESSIDEEIVRCKKVAQYDKWIASTNPQAISKKAGELAQIAITEAYVQRFNAELGSLGAEHIRVTLNKTRTNHGVVMHKLQLAGASTTPSVSLVDVLSEGERRIISLAAFLADVGDKPHIAPFIFDDPISSLDHDYEWRVALRLSQLARDRQVLIFTHRLSLFGAVEEAAKKMGDSWKKDNLVQRFIRVYQGISGHPTEEVVASANTKKANNILLDRLNQAISAGSKNGPEAYERDAQVICTEFRKLLERTVEDDLLNQVVKRHRRSVQTDNRLGALSCITPEDCQLIDGLMTKYSAFEHSQSSETPVRIPEGDELRADLKRLVVWRADFHGRPSKPMA